MSELARSNVVCTDQNHLGKFHIRVLSASSLPDKDTGSDTSDPYAKLSRGQEQGSVTVALFDRDFAAADDTLGTASIPLNSLVAFDGTRTRGNRTVALQGVSGATVTVEARFFLTVDLTQAYLDSLQTGSVVLFRSMTFGGFFIRSGTGSMWSHVGMVGRDAQGDVHVVESSSNLVELPDCFDGSYGDGVEAIAMRDKIQCGLYDAIAVRPLIAPNAAAQSAWNTSLWSTYFEYQKVPYEFETTEMLLGSFNWNDNPDRTSQFCSEFTSELMQRAGILSTAQLSNNMVPREFSSDTPIPLEGGWRWGEEVYFRGVLNYTDGFCYENTEQCGCGPQRKAAGPLVEEQQDKLDNALTGIAIVAIVASIVFLVVCVAIAYKCCCKRDEGKTAPESNHMHEATGKESEGKD